MTSEEKYIQMTQSPVEPLVCRMAIPTIISMLISALYNMADTYFVGQIDTQATAAVGVAFSFTSIVQAIGFFLGHGSGNYMSRKLGEGKSEDASSMAVTGYFLSFITGTVLAIVCMIFINPLTKLLGATNSIIQPTIEYMQIILIGVPFILTSFTINNQLRFQGNAFFGMLGMSGGAVLNIILDPIFIFTLDMGIKGAAYATILSQILGFIALLILSKRNPFKIKGFSLSREIVNAIFKFGTPSLFRQSIACVASICINHAAGQYGDAVIAAVSVVNRVVMIGGFVVIGFGQGFQPVCGFNYGAGLYDRVRKVFKFCIKVSTVFMIIYAILIFSFSENIVQMFRDDPIVIGIGSQMLRFQCITFWSHGVIIMTNMIMQNMGKTFGATLLSISRQGLFFIPLILILPNVLGLMGLEIAQAVADGLAFLVTIPFVISVMNDMNKMVNSEYESKLQLVGNNAK